MAIKDTIDRSVNNVAKSLPGPLKKTPTGKEEAKRRCLEKGGIWDDTTQTCDLSQVYKQQEQAKTEEQQAKKAKEVKTNTKENCSRLGGTWDEKTQSCTFPQSETGANTSLQSVETPQGTFTGLNKEDIAKLQEQQQIINPLGTEAQAQNLIGQVGQFGELPIEATGIDYQEALTTGVVNSIPSAIRLAGQFGTAAAALGAGAGSVVPGAGTAVGAGAGAAIGAGVGFVSGIAGGMISNMKSQRSDTTTSQQRVLDEGKQTMKDWATLIKSDPTNKAQYLAEYNKVSAQIQQAYEQMKLDTINDKAKFETALPNLAEFETFYAEGGERDTLDAEMKNNLLIASNVNYDMIELAYRRKE